MKKIFKITGIILGVVVLLFAGLLVYLSVTEYKPADSETAALEGTASDTLSEGDTLSVMTWNIGYGALGDNADFFMDGGKHVKTASKERVLKNMEGMMEEIRTVGADILFLQETDLSSSRSYRIDEKEMLTSGLPGYVSSFAYNFKVDFIPYPVPPIGKVAGGILTMSRFDCTDSTRLSLPCPFRWPVRLANLKRCLLINRIPLTGSDRELVLVNLHLEAYDSGEGKAAQTEQLKKVLQEEAGKGNYVIAGGDFNQLFSNVDSSAYQVKEAPWTPGMIDTADFDGSWQFLMDASVPTCRSLELPLDTAASKDPKDFSYYMIDGFIVSGNITVESVETQDLGFVCTDHNPVLLKATLASS